MNKCHCFISFRVDYIKHPYTKPYVRPSEDYIAPDGDIDGLTNYKKDYTGELS